ncbi:cyclophilin-like protein [Suhomyces tanzawaensis NRRL Y-17324]|uniref:Peptidyl-prolyl cis-trans isomerase-like 3 n=1 Tax=Suhomyces tanzawaensis NRRL Y-17324 TaxID=984487 RepID=A0A1E4SIF7_9ASCO|nr:cyclophilin-like protein [Suhomyces tanzawaensis NRRL Y-17324]ODV79296.1 cyclophilin-like protein [Suhomyces tanzawaensis NRRL Y-17324]
MSLTIWTRTGPLKVQLHYDAHDASQRKHGENFLVHCAMGTYSGVRILRYIPNFILQTGDSSNTGKQSSPANPSHVYTAIEVKSQAAPLAKRGSIYAVNNPATEDGLGSQFFFVLSEAHSLLITQDNYTYLGEVIDGLDTLSKIEHDEQLSAGKNGKVKGYWKSEAWIDDVTVHYNPFAVA